MDERKMGETFYIFDCRFERAESIAERGREGGR